METFVLIIPVETGDRTDAENIEGARYGSLTELKESTEFQRLGAGVNIRSLSEFMTDWNDTDDLGVYIEPMQHWLSYVTIG